MDKRIIEEYKSTYSQCRGKCFCCLLDGGCSLQKELEKDNRWSATLEYITGLREVIK